jgi:hypothetical protein
MAGALSFVQVIIPVNISGLSSAVQHFYEKVTLLQKGYRNKEKYAVYLKNMEAELTLRPALSSRSVICSI